MWNSSQRAVVLAVVIGVFAYLVIRLSFQHGYISDPQPAEGPRARELADRFDPNLATKAQLAAIPNIGEKLATAVVDYRDRYVADHPGHLAFSQPRDLLRVRGVGPAKMETLCEYLEFPVALPP